MASSVSTQGIYWVYLATFCAMATASALKRPFPGNFDELMHTSYALHLALTGGWSLESIAIPLYDPGTWRLDGTFNHTPHPSGYYLFLAQIAKLLLPFDSADVAVLRLVNVGLATIAVAAALRIGVLTGWKRPVFHAFALPIILIPNLAPLAGAITNDNFAILGGCLVVLGAYRALATTDAPVAAAPVMALGFTLAALAKATAALQVGVLLAAVLAILVARHGVGWLRHPVVILAAAVAVLAMLPYLAMTLEYGSPAPITPGFAADLLERSHARGWDRIDLDLPGYAMHFGNMLAANWPIRAQAGHPILLPGIVMALVAAFGAAGAIRRLARGDRSAIDLLLLCCVGALLATAALHFIAAYGMYRDFHALAGVHPRYYFPLLFVVPAACALAVDTLRPGRNQLIAVTLVILLALAPNLLVLTLPPG